MERIITSKRAAPRVLLVMGVAGSGKSTLGRKLADRMGAAYIEADDLHPMESRQAMSEGRGLTDDMRRPWIDAVGRAAMALPGRVVIACSALRRRHRAALRRRLGRIGIVWVHGPAGLIARRVAARQGHYFPASLVPSQLVALEPPWGEPEMLALDIRSAGVGQLRDALRRFG